ncbi:flippase [Halalkalicoccus tibetensis]|uniref:Flippase n=1 Tax=Halalkalicoccus tibetensis TaxID=175632 RepID=A0ABD5VA77_9EURY
MALVDQIVSGFKIDLVAQVTKMLSGGILAIVLARVLSPDEYGLLYLSISLFTIATLVGTLGLAKSGSRYIIEYEETNPGQIPHIVETVAIILAVLLSVVALGLVILREPLAIILGDPDLALLILVGSLYVISGGITSSARRLCQGFKRIEWGSYIQIIDLSIRPVVAIGLALAGFGAVGALFGYVIGSIIAAVVGVTFLYSQYSAIERSELESGLRRRISEYAIPITLTEQSDTILKRVDIVLVGVFLAPLAVSYYVVAKQVMTFLKAPATSLGFSISPRYSEQVQKGNFDIASKLYSEALSSMLMLYIPAAVGLIIVAEPTLAIMFGPEYVGGAVVLQILTLYLVAQTIAYITEGGLDYLGRAKLRGYAKGGAAIINLILNIILIPTIGISGAAISTAVVYALYVGLCVYLVDLELDLNRIEIGRRLTKISSITAVMLFIILPASSAISGAFSLIAVVGLGVVIWLCGCLVSGLIEIGQLKSVIPI